MLYWFYIVCVFQGVEERDREIKKSREECLKMQQSMEEQLAEERTNNQDNQVGTVTLGEENKKVMEEVKKIKKNTGYRFTKPVTLKVKLHKYF